MHSAGGFAISRPICLAKQTAAMSRPNPSPRSQPTRLREVEPAPLRDAKVIDANFKVVGREVRAVRIIWGALVTIFWAALIGFLIPPAWIFFQSIGEYFAAAN